MSEAQISPRTDGPDDLDLVEDTAPAATAEVDPGSRSRPLGAARRPRPAPSATAPAALLVVLLVAAAVVGIHDLLVHLGAVPGSSWTAAVLSSLDDQQRQSWFVPAGIAVAVVGVLVVLAALRPRRRTHRQAVDDPTLWLRPVDLARTASAAALGTADVATATSTVRRQKVRTKVVSHPNAETDVVHDAVTAAVGAAVDPLIGTVKVVVKVRRAGGAQ